MLSMKQRRDKFIEQGDVALKTGFPNLLIYNDVHPES